MIRAARKRLDRDGLALSMQAVADAVGIRAPSLYKRFPDRDPLLDAVAEVVVGELGEIVAAADRGTSPAAALAGMARAYRAFALRSPHAYALLFERGPAAEPSPAARGAAVAPVLARLTALVGADHALDAGRLFTAWLHGFVSMQLGGAFRLGGDLETSFAYGLDTLIAAVTKRRQPAHR